MSVPVTFELASFPSGYCWPGVQKYATDLIANLTGTIPDIVGVVVGDNDPGADYHDGQWLWVKTNGTYPVGHFVFVGGWIWPHPTAASSQERKLWVGTEADLKTYDGGVDEGVSDTTGPFWVVDHDFDGRFPVGIGTIPGTSTTVVADSSSTGGEDEHTVTEDNLPLLDPRIEMYLADKTTKVNLVGERGTGSATGLGRNVGDNGQNNDPEILIKNIANADKKSYGKETPDPITNLPPYRGLFLIKRSARIYMTG